MSCNSQDNTEKGGYTENDLPNPEKVQPPSDAIPEDMTIKNDSLVTPDSSADTLRTGDSTLR